MQKTEIKIEQKYPDLSIVIYLCIFTTTYNMANHLFLYEANITSYQRNILTENNDMLYKTVRILHVFVKTNVLKSQLEKKSPLNNLSCFVK